MLIRPLVKETHWEQVWRSILEPIFRSGETYPYPRNVTEDEAYQIWVVAPHQTFVAISDDDKNNNDDDDNTNILGTYYIKPNQPGQGSHICNCGYAVAATARGKGVATQMCIDSQRVAAQQLGYRAMQFNMVVSTNDGAYKLWQNLGYDTVGRIPNAFHHPRHGYVDAYVMYKDLTKTSNEEHT